MRAAGFAQRKTGFGYASSPNRQPQRPYSIANVPPGNYKVYFSAGPGYQSQYYNNVPTIVGATQLVVTNGSSANSINAVLATKLNTGTIIGRVVNASNGQPIAGALVELYSINNIPLGNSVYTTSSGDFQISAVNPANYKLRISATGFRTFAPVTQYQVQTNTATQVSIGLSNTVTYTSRVVDSSNASIAGAQIDLIIGGATTTNITSTDSNGYFTITVPVSTSFYLRISEGDLCHHRHQHDVQQPGQQHQRPPLFAAYRFGCLRVVFYGSNSRHWNYIRLRYSLRQPLDDLAGCHGYGNCRHNELHGMQFFRNCNWHL